MNKDEKKELISTLINQRNNLREELGFIYNQVTKNNSYSAEEILKRLGKFSQDLTEHVDLENEVLYVELLKNMKVKGEDTAMTEGFIGEMKNIEAEIKVFLEIYKDVASIEYNSSEFEHEFSKVRRTLVLRIDMEESGIFKYWDQK
ncbi:hypothetical protein BMS3Abin15_00872 [bacterium BMS3Abin15]|nr:hypothetical protein BMS3Abin15_00872 [bacterium BMS3Abin15]HDZ84981.1 hemerythrin domain-containing protein [Candidatus Moranbacteria bacterium]